MSEPLGFRARARRVMDRMLLIMLERGLVGTCAFVNWYGRITVEEMKEVFGVDLVAIFEEWDQEQAIRELLEGENDDGA